MATSYVIFCGICVTVLKELNSIVDEPYMDEPFHVPQAQAYCRGEFDVWDPKLTTPPGLYILSWILKRIFMFKCTLPMLRLTTALNLLGLPIILTYLICFHKRVRPPTSLLSPVLDAIVLSLFPIAWFFGFLYYTEVPSLLFVVWTFVAATEDQHWLAALLAIISCTFRQTNVIWALYAYAYNQLTYLRFRRAMPGQATPLKLHDPPALEASPVDIVKSIASLPAVLPDILSSFIPYSAVLALFGTFIVWNGGIVLGDKSNHIPSLHIPQAYYFVGFATAFGWPIFLTYPGGIPALLRDVRLRMGGSPKRILCTLIIMIVMAVTVNLFTVHHPFLLSDNRHYTFYVWRRIYMLHPVMPYLLIPGYIACAWAWFLRLGQDQTILQTLALPVLSLFTLLPTPLLEPRYFLIPYIFMRSQVGEVPLWNLLLEGSWYLSINLATMWVFLYLPREGVGRFMW